jgi:alpha-tubulin suppressor-like RCC1 family protein
VQGLRSDGTLWVWGLNTSGALGDGTTISKSSPVQLSTFTYGNIGAGPSLTSAYLDRLGQLYTTGVTGALLGSFNTPNTTGVISRSSPAQIGYYIGNSPIQIGSNLWSAISAGNDSSLIANSTKALYFWGVNSNYQSGNVSTPVTANVSSPTLIGTAASSISDGNVNAGYIKKS